MRKVNSILIAVIFMGLTGCGMAEDLTRRCGGYMDTMCDFVLGQDSDSIDDLNGRVSDLEKQIELLSQLISNGMSSDRLLQDKIKELQNNVSINYDRLFYLETQVEVNEDVVQDLVSRVVVLESNEAIVEIIDPCGDSNGVDEVLFVLSSGEVVAWYQNLGLAILNNGSYVTTDNQACNFTVNNGNVNF